MPEPICLTYDSGHKKSGDYEQFLDSQGNAYRISGMTLASLHTTPNPLGPMKHMDTLPAEEELGTVAAD